MHEAIILAGGLGTRLRQTVPDLPKCMAPVAGNPFLYYVISYLQKQGVQEFIFSLGYRHEIIEDWLQRAFPELPVKCVIEDSPLGTGGAIRLAAGKANGENVLVLNGDTLFEADIPALMEVHTRTKADCTLALKPMENFSRYGVVTLNKDGIIASFHEKKYYAHGLINGGIYLLNRASFASFTFPEVFSFEKDFLENKELPVTLAGVIQEGYFIDIGIPEDYARAQKDFADFK